MRRRDVRFWPKAGIAHCTAHVRFSGVKRIWRLHCEMTQSEGKELPLTIGVVCKQCPRQIGGGAMRILSLSLAAGAALVLNSTFSATHAASKNRVGVTYDPPPHASTSGMAHRSSKASRHGANAYGFCPPGQAKKPGRGSAFRC